MGIEDFAERRPSDPGRLQSRYRGVMLGLAAGNALGLAVEGMSAAAIEARFPDGVRDVDPRERQRSWDDDLAQAALLAEALLSDEIFDRDGFAARLVRWFQDNGRGVGTQTRQVLSEILAGVPAIKAAETVWERSGRRAAGNGAVMRCAPVGLRWRASGTHLTSAAKASALVTHQDPRCVWSTVVVSAVIAVLVGGHELDVHELAARLEKSSADTETIEAVHRVPGCTLDELQLDGEASGYTLKTMQVALWCAEQPASFESVLQTVVNAGGDTDTNGAVAGAVMAARMGVDAIPRRWLSAISGTGRLLGIADRLLVASMRRPALAW